MNVEVLCLSLDIEKRRSVGGLLSSQEKNLTDQYREKLRRPLPQTRNTPTAPSVCHIMQDIMQDKGPPSVELTSSSSTDSMCPVTVSPLPHELRHEHPLSSESVGLSFSPSAHSAESTSAAGSRRRSKQPVEPQLDQLRRRLRPAEGVLGLQARVAALECELVESRAREEALARRLAALEGMPSAVREAAQDGDDDALQDWLDGGGRVNATVQVGWPSPLRGVTLLMIASIHGHERVVSMLLRRGAQPNKQDEKGGTALMAAAYRNHPGVVRLLLEHSADASLQDANQRRALEWAEAAGHEECAHCLREHAAVQSPLGTDGSRGRRWRSRPSRTCETEPAVASSSPDSPAPAAAAVGPAAASTAGVTPSQRFWWQRAMVWLSVEVIADRTIRPSPPPATT